METDSNETLYQWDKDKFIEQKINKNRNLDWYILRYKRNLTIGLTLAALTFFNTASAFLIYKHKNDEIKVYLTASSGQIINYKNTDFRKKKLDAAVAVIRSKKGKK